MKKQKFKFNPFKPIVWVVAGLLLIKGYFLHYWKRGYEQVRKNKLLKNKRA